jgi:hypothetical protein
MFHAADTSSYRNDVDLINLSMKGVSIPARSILCDLQLVWRRLLYLVPVVCWSCVDVDYDLTLGVEMASCFFCFILDVNLQFY